MPYYQQARQTHQRNSLPSQHGGIKKLYSAGVGFIQDEIKKAIEAGKNLWPIKIKFDDSLTAHKQIRENARNRIRREEVRRLFGTKIAVRGNKLRTG